MHFEPLQDYACSARYALGVVGSSSSRGILKRDSFWKAPPCMTRSYIIWTQHMGLQALELLWIGKPKIPQLGSLLV
jgi:hypothetical protein